MNYNEKNPGPDLDAPKTPAVEAELRLVDPHLAVNRDLVRQRREHVYGPVVLGICHDAIAEVYMSRVRHTIQATLDGARYRVYAEQIRLDGEHGRNPAVIPDRPCLKLPTRHLIQSMIEEIPPFERYAVRFGRHAAMVRYRPRNVQKGALIEMAASKTANCDTWHERVVLNSGVYFGAVRYNSHLLMELRAERRSLRVEVRLDKPDASALLVRVPRRRTVLLVPAVSPLTLRASKENSQ